jgi:hypothetical protein
MSDVAIIKYSGTAPIGDSATYALFSTVTTFPGARMPQGAGLKRLVVDLKHSQNGTFKLYKSSDRGTNWYQVDEAAATATGATASDVYDALIEEYDDFKLDWTNGGVAQATWNVSIALSSERSPSA